ncbi:MAG: hypothetical protein FWB74_06995 [Defluviitaleaceae bacterium]|nr:hypothetical protein [Defluviitaleaceae bacterium]
MRKPNESIYYIAGTLCLIFSVFLILQTGLSPANFANRIFREDRAVDRGYSEYYRSELSLHKNSLRQAAVFLPVYSLTTDGDVARFMEAFGMEGAAVSVYPDYFRADCGGGRVLRIYRYMDLIEFEMDPGTVPSPASPDRAAKVPKDVGQSPISSVRAGEIAKEFAQSHFYMNLPHDVAVTGRDGGFHVSLIELLGKIPNLAFPTTITMDNYGNILTATHFYFEYEELARGDIMTPRAALPALPREHVGQATIESYELVYIFAQSILQPAYIFRGYYPCGTPFTHPVSAIKYFH